MTSKEAIKHCYEVLERNDLCEECKKEHLQLAHWLERLEKLEEENASLQNVNVELIKENSKLLIENERLDTILVTLEELNNINKKFDDLATKAVNENTKLKKVIEILKEYIGLKSVLDFDTYLRSLDKSDQNLLEEFLDV